MVTSSPKQVAAAASATPPARNVIDDTKTTTKARKGLPLSDRHLHSHGLRSSGPPNQHLARPIEPARSEVVALDHDPVRRRLPLDLLEPGHRPAGDFGDPEGERGRLVLLGDAVLGDVAVEVLEARHGPSVAPTP